MATVTKLLNEVLNYATKYEKHNMHAAGKEHCVDAILLGMMKNADDYRSSNKEAETLYDKIVQTFGDKPFEIRTRLKYLMGTSITEEDKQIYDKMREELKDKDIIDTIDMFDAILKHPSDTILAILVEKKPEDDINKNMKEEKTEVPHMKESQNNIEDLVLQVRSIRDNLLDKVYGQNHAVNSFVDGFWNAEISSMTHDEKQKTRGVFVFAGPSGVGKTFLAEEAAKEMGVPYKKFDMSGYAHHDSVCDLTGFSSTYKDAKRGMLTDFVAKNGKCVVIFDEIEKAHKDVIML